MNTLDAELAEFVAWNKLPPTEDDDGLLVAILDLDQLSSGATYAFVAYMAGKASARREQS